MVSRFASQVLGSVLLRVVGWGLLAICNPKLYLSDEGYLAHIHALPREASLQWLPDVYTQPECFARCSCFDVRTTANNFWGLEFLQDWPRNCCNIFQSRLCQGSLTVSSSEAFSSQTLEGKSQHLLLTTNFMMSAVILQYINSPSILALLLFSFTMTHWLMWRICLYFQFYKMKFLQDQEISLVYGYTVGNFFLKIHPFLW